MTRRRPLLFTVSDLKRAIRAALDADLPAGWAVTVRPDGTLTIARTTEPAPAVDDWRDVRL